MNRTREVEVQYIKKYAICPKCGAKRCGRHSIGRRRLRDLGQEKPLICRVIYSKHKCKECKWIFSNPKSEIFAIKRGRFTLSVMREALKCLIECGMTYEKTKQHLLKNYHVKVPIPTMNDWVINFEAEKYKGTISLEARYGSTKKKEFV